MSLPPLGTQRMCCDTKTGDTHRSCPATGHNAHGCQMCVCGNALRPHSYEPGESCTPNGPVIPRPTPEGDPR